MCFIDDYNWCKDVLFIYKSNCKDMCKFVGLVELKCWLGEYYEIYLRFFLEVDDVMGILVIWKGFYFDYWKIVISEDKDMKILFVWFYNFVKDFEFWLNFEEDVDFFYLC